MLIGRYAVAFLTIQLAGALVVHKRVPHSLGTLRTYTPLFVIWLLGIILIVGILSFIPVLVLGPIVEALM